MSKKVAIIYASMSGNTEDIATEVSKHLEPFEFEMLEMENLDASVVLDYDGILLGTYTWGDGDLPYEAEEFHDQLDEIDLSGKVVGCFGSGDHAYPLFCEAVNHFQNKVIERGATVVQESLKIELAPESEEDLEQCKSFALQFVQLLT